MRKIESAMIEAIKWRKNWQSGNTSVSVSENRDRSILVEVRLHGNLIASLVFPSYDSIAPSWIKITDGGGYQTVTTKSRLNAILFAFTGLINFPLSCRVVQKDFRWYIETNTKRYVFGNGAFITPNGIKAA